VALWVAVLSGVFEGKKACEKTFGEGRDALMVVLVALQVISRANGLWEQHDKTNNHQNI
jgi:hypothetical protein